MSRNQRLLSFLLVLAAPALLPQAVCGQPKVKQTPHIVEVVIGADKESGAALKGVDLRPNTPVELEFDLKNQRGEILGDVTLKIVQIVKGQDRVIAEAKVPKIEKGAGQRVQMFDK